MNTAKIYWREFSVILNNMYLEGIREVRVEYPFLEIPLLKINMENYEIEILADKKDFERGRKDLPKFLQWDLANYHDFLDSFIVGGIVPFRNAEDVEKLLNLKIEEFSEPFFSPKPIFIGIDTNVAYYKAISNFYSYDKLGYAIAQTVLEEIDARIHDKYTPREIDYFQSLPYGKYARYFVNGSVKESRIAKMALGEILWMEKNLKTLRVKSGEYVQDKELRDRLIVESYAKFAEEYGIEIIVMSADKDFAFHAESFGIPSIHLEIPHDFPSKIRAEFENVLKLIYVLAEIMGIIKIRDYIILGEFPGKGSEDYAEGALSLITEDKRVLRDIEICRRWLNEQ